MEWPALCFVGLISPDSQYSIVLSDLTGDSESFSALESLLGQNAVKL